MRDTFAWYACALLLAACGGESHTGADGGGHSGHDSGSTLMDSGTPPGTDSGTPPGTDSGTPPGTDSGTPPGTDAGMPTRTGAVGSGCETDADCTEPAGATCMTMVGGGGFSYEFPGGYCTAECTAGSGSSQCGAGADCYSIGFGGFGTAFCAKTCSTDADCRADEGYSCMAPPIGGGTTRYCLPPRGGTGGFDGGGFFP